MADPASLVIGSVGLLALFDSCMNAFTYVETGKAYGTDYQASSLKIRLLQLRLSRWHQSVDIRDDLSEIGDKVQVADEDVETVRDLLGSIKSRFDEAEKASKRYKSKDPPTPGDGANTATLEAVAARVEKLALTCQKEGSFGQKTRWALHDKKKFADLISGLEDKISDLVDLFPAIQKAQARLAVADVREVVESDTVADRQEAVAVLSENSRGIDEGVASAIKQLADEAEAGYDIHGLKMGDKARAQFGAYYAKGQTVADERVHATYKLRDINLTGESKSHFGPNIGGKYILDDDDGPGSFHKSMHEDRDAGPGAGQ